MASMDIFGSGDPRQRGLVKTFNISHFSSIDNKRYEGQFTTQKLRVGDWIRIGVVKSSLSMNCATLDVRATDYCEMLAVTQVALIQKPHWFEDPQELYDGDILSKVYEEVMKFENSFRRASSGIGSEASGGTVSEEQGRRSSPRPNNGSDDDEDRNVYSSSVVVSEIQPSRKRVE